MSFIKSNDKLINYNGRWEKTDKGMVSHWCRPYLEFKIKAKYVKFVLENGSGGYSVKIDNVVASNSGSGCDHIYYFNDDKAHVIKITASSGRYPTIIKGFETDGELFPLQRRKKNYLFIGDSLTESGYAYPAVIHNKLNADFTCIAMGGIAMQDGKGYYEPKSDAGENYSKEGMETAFYNWNCPVEAGEHVKYSFKDKGNKTYDAIFISLGTNDALGSNEAAIPFIKKYVSFIKDVSKIYGGTKIYLVLPIADNNGGYRRNAIETASKEAATLLKNVTYVSSRGWDIPLTEDNVHPTPDGYKAFAEKLIKKIGLKK